MSKYTEKALECHSKGYNCAQSVACAFSERIGIDEVTLHKLSEGFGAGMGNRKGACGALSGAIFVAGAVIGSGDPLKLTKMDTYKVSGKIYDEFVNRCKAVNCEDIKGEKTGTPTVSCSECIVYAVEAVEKIVFGE